MEDGDKKYSFKVPEEKKISITLCGKTFLISAHFSMNDMQLYMEALERGDDAKSALADIVYRKLQKSEPPILTQDEVHLENDSAFEPYILAIINSDNALSTVYAETDASLPITERFAIATRQYWKDCTKKIAETMQPALKAIEQINRSVDFSWINNINSTLVQFAQRTAEIMAPIQNAISQYANTFSDIIANIQIPTFSQERKRQLEEAYKEWGRSGWSVIPHAPLKLFNKVPADIKEADKVALRYFNKKGMEYLFAEIRERPIKKEDLNSSIFCFEHRQYKACASLLFGIIDSKLIRLQPKKMSKNRRQVGTGAVKELEAKFKEKADTELFLYHILYFSGLIECLRTFFANGNDFRAEPKVINRNFIDHGMNRRSVRRKDCVQLFLALYNLTELLEDL